MTIREAFSKAGYPVPEGAKIGILDYCGPWFYSLDNRQHQFAEFADGYQWTDPSEWGKIMHERVEVTRRMIDLSNLPAVDALDALPECVRKVVQ